MQAISVNNQSLNTYLAQQESIAILQEFNQARYCHAIYHPYKSAIQTRKPRPRNLTIIKKQQVFFYYLSMLPTKIKTKYDSLSATLQTNIQTAIQHKSITSTNDFIATLIKLIKSA